MLFLLKRKLYAENIWIVCFFLYNPHNSPMRNISLSPLLQVKELKITDTECLAENSIVRKGQSQDLKPGLSYSKACALSPEPHFLSHECFLMLGLQKTLDSACTCTMHHEHWKVEDKQHLLPRIFFLSFASLQADGWVLHTWDPF